MHCKTLHLQTNTSTNDTMTSSSPVLNENTLTHIHYIISNLFLVLQNVVLNTRVIHFEDSLRVRCDTAHIRYGFTQ